MNHKDVHHAAHLLKRLEAANDQLQSITCSQVVTISIAGYEIDTCATRGLRPDLYKAVSEATIEWLRKEVAFLNAELQQLGVQP
jgi:hypothetical protein